MSGGRYRVIIPLTLCFIPSFQTERAYVDLGGAPIGDSGLVAKLGEYPVLELPSAGDAACGNLSLLPKPTCLPPTAQTTSQGGRVCPGSPDVRRIFDPSAPRNSLQRNFMCAQQQLCCQLVKETKAAKLEKKRYEGHLIAEEFVGGAAAYAKYRNDVFNYRRVFPAMSNCEGSGRAQCLDGEKAVFFESASYCDGLEAAMQTKCYLTAMQHRIATSGLFYTYDDGTVPTQYNNVLDNTIFADHQRPAIYSELMSDNPKDPFDTMKDGQGDCEDMAFLMKMYCDESIASGKIAGTCSIVAGTVPSGNGHSVCVYKDDNGEAYVLDGTYFQEKDTSTLTDDRSWNPDELMRWEDYRGTCDNDCRHFEPYAGTIASNPDCFKGGDDLCDFQWMGVPSQLNLDQVSMQGSIDSSISAADLKAARWEHHGLSVPLDQFDLDSAETYMQAQYVSSCIRFSNPTDLNILNLDSIAAYSEGLTHFLDQAAGSWISAIFAFHQLRQSRKKREALKLLNRLLKRSEEWWAKKSFNGEALKRILYLMSDVFCSNDPEGDVYCFNEPASNGVELTGHAKVANALTLFHRRDATFSYLHEICSHVDVRFKYLRTILVGNDTVVNVVPQCDQYSPAQQMKKNVTKWEKSVLEEQLKVAAKSVGISWKSKKIRVGFWRSAPKGGLPPLQHKLRRSDGGLIKELANKISALDICAFLMRQRHTVEVLASLSAYDQYEQEHWRLQSIWKAGATTALSFVPLFGAVDFMRSYFYFKSAAYHSSRLMALHSRIAAGTHVLGSVPVCVANDSDRVAGSELIRKLDIYRYTEGENIAFLLQNDKDYAVIHIVSGLGTGPAYTLGPLGVGARIITRALLKSMAFGLNALTKYMRKRKLPNIDMEEIFDGLQTLSEPRCRSILAKTLFDLNEHQFEAIASGNWIRKGVFVPSMSVPSFQNVKLWKTWLGSGAPKLLRQWKKLRLAPPETGFGLQSVVECEPQPQCLRAENASLQNAFFLRVSAWKVANGSLSWNPKPETSAVKKWNKKKVDQQVHLNDIITTVNGISPQSFEDDLLEEIDNREKDMRVSLQVLNGFVTFPSLAECTGKIFRSDEFLLEHFDPGAASLITADAFKLKRRLLFWKKKKQNKLFARKPSRVFLCERLCLAEPACDAIDVVISRGSEGATKVLCQLVRDDEREARESTAAAPLGPREGEAPEERTCWLRTRLAKPSPAAQDSTSELELIDYDIA